MPPRRTDQPQPPQVVVPTDARVPTDVLQADLSERWLQRRTPPPATVTYIPHPASAAHPEAVHTPDGVPRTGFTGRLGAIADLVVERLDRRLTAPPATATPSAAGVTLPPDVAAERAAPPRATTITTRIRRTFMILAVALLPQAIAVGLWVEGGVIGGTTPWTASLDAPLGMPEERRGTLAGLLPSHALAVIDPAMDHQATLLIYGGGDPDHLYSIILPGYQHRQVSLQVHEYQPKNGGSQDVRPALLVRLDSTDLYYVNDAPLDKPVHWHQLTDTEARYGVVRP